MEIKLLGQEDITEELQAQLSELYLQLNAQLEQVQLSTILEVPENIDIAACFEKNILIGIAMMANYKVVSGYKGIIEDVVVSEQHRSKGIGRKLMELLLKEAKIKKVNDVLLFTSHQRTAAIALYKSLGFNMKSSGLYVKKLD